MIISTDSRDWGYGYEYWPLVAETVTMVTSADLY